MAEKRGPGWMCSVGNMFWTQWGMAIFLYGMFKDSNGKLRATVCILSSPLCVDYFTDNSEKV